MHYPEMLLEVEAGAWTEMLQSLDGRHIKPDASRQLREQERQVSRLLV